MGEEEVLSEWNKFSKGFRQSIIEEQKDMEKLALENTTNKTLEDMVKEDSRICRPTYHGKPCE